MLNRKLNRPLTAACLLALMVLAILTPRAYSQESNLHHIESDDEQVQRMGLWQPQNASGASGGSYLFNSPSPLGGEGSGVGTALQLEFSGPSIEVMFVTGPSLGTLVINVDDIVLRTVITTAETTAYQQSSRIDYLSDEPHTLKVYAQAGGVVGVDAFVVPTSPPTDETTVSGLPRDPFCAPTDQIHRVSLTSTGEQVMSYSTMGSMSNDGRYVSFHTNAQLVPADANVGTDVYIYDRQTCTVELISVQLDSDPTLDLSFNSIMSGDGRYVVFYSTAHDLVPNPSWEYKDIFVRDRLNATTIRVSAPTDGTLSNGGATDYASISADGHFIAFDSDASNLVPNDTNSAWGVYDTFVYEIATNTITRVSVASGGIQANGSSGVPALSGDGRYVAFISGATNLVADDTNNQSDVFVHDRQTVTTTRVSVATGGIQAVGGAPDIRITLSADGRYVAFASNATNLVAGDTNGQQDAFVHDRQTNTTTRVSVASDGTQGNGRSGVYAISADGRYVGIYSDATNLVSNDTNAATDAFVHDRLTGITSRVTVNSAGEQIAGGAGPIFSDDGRYLAFESTDSTLVVGDTNGRDDVFVVPFNRGLAPTSLTATAVSQSGIHLSWTDNASDETEYRLERSPDGLDNWLEIGIAPANTTTSTNVSLICGTTYHYRVRAYRASDMTYSAYSNVATATTSACPPAAPSNLTATTISQTGIQLTWTDNASDETNFGIERSPNGTSGWSQIGSTLTNVANFTDTIYLTCGTTYHYRVRAYRSGDGVFSAYSFFVASATTSACVPDALAIVNPATRSANLLETLNNPPAPTDYTQFATGFPHGTGGRYVTGDWNGDGVDTIGVYWNGAFFFTNDYGTGGTWGGVWFGLGGQPVVGRFDANVNHDCLGVTDSGTWFTGDAYFALYFTCNLTSGPTPPLTFQWLSILLPSSQGFTGTHQFVAGDFDGDGVDSVAVRRGGFIAWTNIPPTTLLTQFNLAQYIGAPGNGDEGKVVTGDWDMSNMDSFGLVYQNGTFYRRNDLDWNSGVYILQQFASQVGTPFDVASWRPK